jgi:hypothetical protein
MLALKKDDWADETLRFALTDGVYDLELRGFLVSDNTTSMLDRIRLTQTREPKRLKVLHRC